MGTEFSILTGKEELLLDGCSPETKAHTGTSEPWWLWLNGVEMKTSASTWREYHNNYASLCFTFLTLNSGGWADDKCLLEGFRLAAQPSRTCWNWDTLLSESRNVDGGLLVQCRLVVEQRNCSPRRRHLLEKHKILSAAVIEEHREIRNSETQLKCQMARG